MISSNKLLGDKKTIKFNFNFNDDSKNIVEDVLNGGEEEDF